MRIALVSDIHGNLPALEAVAADIRRRGADRVVNLGDNLSGPLLPRETAQWLMASGYAAGSVLFSIFGLVAGLALMRALS